MRWGLVRDRTLLRRKWLHIIINDDFLEKGECYDRALLPSIICLGRLRIASKYIFNLWQLRREVDSFLSCRKMGTRPGLDFIRRKWLNVIINDDFLEKGVCYDRALLPSIICLGRLRIASKYIFNLWHLRQGVDSLAQWLQHLIFNREDRVRFQRQAWDVFQLCFIPLLRLSCRKMGTRPRLDFTTPKMA